MTTFIHLATSLDALLAWVSTAWLALGELVSVAGLLLALNFIASAIHRTYQAGYFCGSVWYRYAVPAILWAADRVSYINSQIDWIQVRSDLATYSKAIVAFVVTVAVEAQPTLVRFSERLGKFYAAVLLGDHHIQPSAAFELSQEVISRLRQLGGRLSLCRQQAVNSCLKLIDTLQQRAQSLPGSLIDAA